MREGVTDFASTDEPRATEEILLEPYLRIGPQDDLP